MPDRAVRRVPRLVPGERADRADLAVPAAAARRRRLAAVPAAAAASTYVNVGFWSTVPVGATEGETNRLIEREVSELDGHKSLYSDAYYSREEFDELYGGETYRAVKAAVRPRLTTARPLCEGGATTMTTFKERGDGCRRGPARPRDGCRGAPRHAGKLTLAEVLEIFAGGRLPLRFTAYDGSSAGPPDAPFGLELKTPRGTTYLATGSRRSRARPRVHRRRPRDPRRAPRRPVRAAQGARREPRLHDCRRRA